MQVRKQEAMVSRRDTVLFRPETSGIVSSRASEERGGQSPDQASSDAATINLERFQRADSESEHCRQSFRC